MNKHIISTLSIALLLSTPLTLNAGKKKYKKQNAPSSSSATKIISSNDNNLHDGDEIDVSPLLKPLAITPVVSSHTPATPALNELASLKAERDAARTALLYFMGQKLLLTTQNNNLQKQLAAATNNLDDDMITLETASTGSSDNKDSLLTATTTTPASSNTLNDPQAELKSSNNNVNPTSVPAPISTVAWLTSFVYSAKK
jgi:hypothetical protein